MLKIGNIVGSKEIARINANNKSREQTSRKASKQASPLCARTLTNLKGVKQESGKQECKHVGNQGENLGDKLRKSQKEARKQQN